MNNNLDFHSSSEWQHHTGTDSLWSGMQLQRQREYHLVLICNILATSVLKHVETDSYTAVNTHSHTHTHTHTHTHARTHTHIHTHARTHARTHTQTHTHTLSRSVTSPGGFYCSVGISSYRGPLVELIGYYSVCVCVCVRALLQLVFIVCVELTLITNRHFP